MNKKVIVDTGPIVAFLNANDTHHKWAKQQLSSIKPPLLTCEAVLAEICFLLNKNNAANGHLFELLHRELLVIPFVLSEEKNAIKNLMMRYQNVPISLADACLVRISEQYSNSVVLTLDEDFHIYRRHGRLMIPTLMPK